MNVGRILTSGVFTMLLFTVSVFAQSPFLFDNFEYSTGALSTVSSGEWFLGSGNADFQVNSTNLDYPGYADDNSINSVTIVNSNDQIAARYFAQTSSTVYYSFLVNISSAPSVGRHFTSLGDEFLNIPYGPAYVREVDGNLNFGIGRFAGGEDTTWASGSYAKSTVHLLVIKYVFVGGASNDSVYLYINPSLAGGEPASADAAVQNVGGESDPLDLRGVMIFEFESNGISANFDAIRVASTWEYAPLPVQFMNLAGSASSFGVDLQWSTASELNNYGFEIERRSVGASEQGSVGASGMGASEWITVGFVQGAGTSTETREYSFTDTEADFGRYAYRIKQIDMNGAFTYYGSLEIEVGVGPKDLALDPNYPNPFNPSTNISFTVPQDGHATLKVFNMLGQEVATLFDEEAIAGRLYKQTFDASSLPTGVYVSRLEFGGRSVMRKMLFVK